MMKAANTVQQEPSAEKKSHYPRPTWFAVARQLLLLSGLTLGALYIILFLQALIRHTLHTVDRDLLTPTNIVLFASLTSGGIWAMYDAVKDRAARRQQRQAEWNLPWEVRAERRWRAALAKARTRGDRQAEAVALGNIGFWVYQQERLSDAQQYIEEALVLTREVNDHFHEERDLFYLANCARDRGDMDAAEALYRKSLAITVSLTPEQTPFHRSPQLSIRGEIADSYAILGHFLAAYHGKPVEGCQMLAKAEACYRENARYYEQEAKKFHFDKYSRMFKEGRALTILEDAQHMRELQEKYTTH